jgi:hypothetical protein
MSRAYGWRASCPAGGVTVVGVGSGAWFASVVWADRIIWGFGFCLLRSGILGSGFRVLDSGFWIFGCCVVWNFILPKSVFATFGKLSSAVGRKWLDIN